MTPEGMAALHKAAMTTSAPWSAAQFAETLSDGSVFPVVVAHGFALGRAVLDEAELLTLAVAPEAQGRGIGRTLLSRFEEEAALRGAASAFLEVAIDNPPARSLYVSMGWEEAGRRKAYYPRPSRPAADALVLRKVLTCG